MNPELPSSKPPCHRDDAMLVVSRLWEAGHVAYFAGGCVRDMLMGLQPKDWDVATDAPPEKVRALFRSTQAVGAAFGVILVRMGESVIEVATFRADGTYLDGRRPSEVRFTNAEEDARRRDFTINGIFLDPEKNQFIDYVGGQADIKAKVLRAIGNPADRFNEDYLRMLRAVRFAARFSLTIDPATADAIRLHAPRLAQISPERIAEELRVMLAPPTRVEAYRLLDELNLLPVLFRRFKQQRRTSLTLLSRLPEQPLGFGLSLAAITLSELLIAPTLEASLEPQNIRKVAQTWRETLKISNDESDAFVRSLSIGQLLQPTIPSVAVMKRFLAGDHSHEARTLLQALSAELHTSRIGWLFQQFAAFPADQIAPPPLVTGDDLVSAGLPPGKMFKTVLDAVYDLQLEGKLTSKEAAMAEALKLASSR